MQAVTEIRQNDFLNEDAPLAVVTCIILIPKRCSKIICGLVRLRHMHSLFVTRPGDKLLSWKDNRTIDLLAQLRQRSFGLNERSLLVRLCRELGVL